MGLNISNKSSLYSQIIPHPHISSTPSRMSQRLNNQQLKDQKSIQNQSNIISQQQLMNQQSISDQTSSSSSSSSSAQQTIPPNKQQTITNKSPSSLHNITNQQSSLFEPRSLRPNRLVTSDFTSFASRRAIHTKSKIGNNLNITTVQTPNIVTGDNSEVADTKESSIKQKHQNIHHQKSKAQFNSSNYSPNTQQMSLNNTQDQSPQLQNSYLYEDSQELNTNIGINIDLSSITSQQTRKRTKTKRQWRFTVQRKGPTSALKLKQKNSFKCKFSFECGYN